MLTSGASGQFCKSCRYQMRGQVAVRLPSCATTVARAAVAGSPLWNIQYLPIERAGSATWYLLRTGGTAQDRVSAAAEMLELAESV